MSEDIKKLIDQIEEDDSLEHYGVLGMRWGVRKDRRTGRRVGRPVAGTKAASRSTPSIQPKQSSQSKSKSKSKSSGSTAKKAAPTKSKASSSGKPKAQFTIKERVKAISDKAMGKKSGAQQGNPNKLSADQISQLNKGKLDPKSLTVPQMEEATKILRLQKEVQSLSGNSGRKQDIRKMSTKDLQEMVNRAELEKRYRELTKGPPTKRERLKQEAAKIAADVARTQAKRVLNRAAGNMVDNLLGDISKARKEKIAKEEKQEKKKKK